MRNYAKNAPTSELERCRDRGWPLIWILSNKLKVVSGLQKSSKLSKMLGGALFRAVVVDNHSQCASNNHHGDKELILWGG